MELCAPCAFCAHGFWVHFFLIQNTIYLDRLTGVLNLPKSAKAPATTTPRAGCCLRRRPGDTLCSCVTLNGEGATTLTTRQDHNQVRMCN
jgi:hypothetical protein